MQVTWSSFHSPYSDAEVKKYVPTEAGVYLLWVKLKNGNWRCFYVGRTRNLEERLLEHLSESEENECLENKASNYVCGFEYAKIAKQADREGVEKFLYDHYGPECNTADPGGTPIQVNLPKG